MRHQDIACQRLHNQLITQRIFARPSDVVGSLLAVQAQDYAAAKWALGLRSQDTTEDAIEQALTAGTILRTHVMRPTWHFVLPADIRWLLALTAPRVNAAAAYWYRKLELDDALFTRSNAVIARALQGGKQLTRSELMVALQQAGIAINDPLRSTHLMMRAELDAIVCSGARRGKQFTYALLDERAPQADVYDRDEALAQFASRYFASHGPATVQDFAWWSGLTVVDARTALDMIKSQLIYEVVNGQVYWFAHATPPIHNLEQTTYLLPNFDEYTVGYADRSAIFAESHTAKLDSRNNIIFNNTIVIDGRVIGTWKRTLKKASVALTPTFWAAPTTAETQAFLAAASRYSAFLALSIE